MIRMEELEVRFALSYVVLDQTLFWTGTHGRDAVVFESLDTSTIRVTEFARDGLPSQLVYDVSDVLRLDATARDGDDLIDASRVTVPTTLVGGPGGDTLLGGSNADLIFGDADEGMGEGDFIDAGAGNDTVYADGAEGGKEASDTVFGGEGDDVIYGDGGEGAADFLDGGDGDDWIRGGYGANTMVGGGGNDVLVGGVGSDLLLGGAGDDVLIGMVSLDWLRGDDGRDLLIGSIVPPAQIPILAAAWRDGTFLSDKVVDVILAGGFVRDLATDVLDGGADFNLLFDEDLPDYTYGSLSTGATYVVATAAELGNALAAATHGDRVLIEPGVYDLSILVTRTWNNVSIIGMGDSPDDVVLHGVQFHVTSPAGPFLLSNLTSDLTGVVTLPNGGAHVFRGKTVLDRVEVFGVSNVSTPALYFSSFMGQTSSVTSEVILSKCYVHNVSGDAISTGGYGSSEEVLANSRVMLFATRGHTAGPYFYNQVLTAHAGYHLVDVGGHYWDAVLSVIAPDNASTRIDLYFTVVEAGARKAGVDLPSRQTVVYGATLLNQDRLEIHGQIRFSRVKSLETKVSGAMIVAYDDAVLADNTFVCNNPGYATWGVRVVGDNVEIVDNLFENWDGGFEIDDHGVGTWIDGNVFV